MVMRETATAPAFTQRNSGRGDPLAPARQRGVDNRTRLLAAEGGTLTVRDVAARLGVVQRVVEERRRAGTLLAFPARGIRYVYPAWQFGAHGLLPGVEEVLTILETRDPWVRASFLLAKNAYLGGAAPLDELRRGHMAEVRRAAQAYREHGAA